MSYFWVDFLEQYLIVGFCFIEKKNKNFKHKNVQKIKKKCILNFS